MQYKERTSTHGEGRAGWGHTGMAEGLLGMFQAPDSILELETKPPKATKPTGLSLSFGGQFCGVSYEDP